MSERIQKVLADLGLGSRREIEDWIRVGRVTLNGQCAQLGDKVEPHSRLTVDGQPIHIPHALCANERETRVIIYYKPEGEVCTRHDPEGRPSVFRKLPRIQNARWISVGRLDINSSGLLLFTSNGELANRLMHPSFTIEREYAVRVMGEVTSEVIDQLKKGVNLEDGPAKFQEIIFQGGSGINRWYHVVICEGRKREVRRLWEALGLTVSRLIRVRYGKIELPRTLRIGNWQELEANQVNYLLQSVKLAKQAPLKKPPVKSTFHKRRNATQ